MAGESQDNSACTAGDEPEESPEVVDEPTGEDPEGESEQPDEVESAEPLQQPPSTQSRSYSLGEDLGTLEMVLQTTRRELRQPAIIEGMLWYGTTVLAVVVASLIAAAFIPEYGYAVGRWMMLIGVAFATVGAIAAGVVFRMRRPSLEGVAAKIQRHDTGFRSDLVAALQFGRQLAEDGGEELVEQGVSPAMARAQLGRTARKVREQSEEDSLSHCVPPRDLTPATLGFAAGIALLLAPLIFNPGWTLGVLTGERLGAPVVGERVAEESIVGSVDGVFVYPSYTERDRDIRNLGTGRIETLQGTEVHLHATLLPGDWASLEMVVQTGEDNKEVIDMTLDGGHQASATLQIEESGYYWFRGETIEGRPVEDRAERRIEVHEDPPPSVQILSHEGRVEVEPDEVVEFKIQAEDTFGLDSMWMAHHFEGAGDDPERQRLELTELADRPTEVETTAELDLTPLELRPKDAIEVYFEARDVNTATGPGEAKSSSVVLYVESPEDRHMESIAAQQETMEALLSHLGDTLESPVGNRKMRDDGSYDQQVEAGMDRDERHERYDNQQQLNDRRESLAEAMHEVAEKLEDDPMMVSRNLTLFSGMGDRLESIHEEGQQVFHLLDDRAQRRDLTAANLQQVADFCAEAEADLERMVLDLEDLLISQKMDLVETTAEQIDEMRDRLRDLLEQYRDTDDPELREAIQREMDRLRQRMQELMSRMQMQMREMPQEHVNLEAMEGMDMQQDADDLGSQLDAIDEMLDSDDIDGALEALEGMEDQLDAMSGEMEQSFGEMQPQGISEFDEAMGDMMDQVTMLREQEADLEEETRQLQQDLREERQDQLDAMLDPVTDELQAEIEAQKRELDRVDARDLPERDQEEVDRSTRSVESLEEMVKQQDMEEALDRARTSRDTLQSMRATMTLSQRYADEDSQQAEALEQSVDDAHGLIERAERIEERIEDFMEQANQNLQSEEEERFDELAEQQGEIADRTEQLGEQIQEQSADYPQLEQELGPSVEGAEEAMREAEESLRERRSQQALDDERRALEQLGELDDSMSQAMQQQRQQEREERGQQQRADDEEVEIPGEDGDAEARERIREEMMEGMRDGRLEEYESEIERYFRSLVE